MKLERGNFDRCSVFVWGVVSQRLRVGKIGGGLLVSSRWGRKLLSGSL